MTETRRRRIRRACLILAALAGGVAFALWAGASLNTHLFGVRLTLNNPTRAAAIAVALFAGYLAAGGRVWHRSRAQWLAALALARRVLFHVRQVRHARFLRLPPWAAVVALAAATLAIAARYGSHSVGGADSYGYVSQARLWLTGHLRQPQPWVEAVPWPDAALTFSPLGYFPAPQATALVPMYAPGYPLLMAVAMLLGGFRAAFAVAPLSAAATIWATYALGRRLGSAWGGVVAAWLVLTSPAFMRAFLVAPMSDVPVTAAWTAALVLVLAESRRSALAAGLVSGLAVLIRLNLLPLAGVLFLWTFQEALQRRAGGRSDWWHRAVFYLAGVTPAILALAVFNRALYGSPFRTGYGDVEGWFALAHVGPNLQRYAQWLTETQTPLVWCGAAALLAPVPWLWSASRDRRAALVLAAFVVVVWGEDRLYQVWDVWWYLRFLLPIYPLVMVGLGQITVSASRTDWWLGVGLLVAMAALGGRGVVVAADRWAFSTRLEDSRYAVAGRIVRQITEPTSVVFSMQHSGSLRFYGSRMTMRYDYLNERWLDRAVEWYSAHGIHAYALLEDWEVAWWRRQFDPLNTLSRLDWRPMVVLNTSGHPALYDLTSPGGGAATVVSADLTDEQITPPAAVRPFKIRD